ncbi:MAG: choice-of-anchor tandem repeat GloVer-containing protein [Bacteroidota bacterium]
MKKSNLFLIVVCFLTVNISLLTSKCFAQYTMLTDFSGAANGSNPQGSLYSDGTFLYGMTSDGGANGYGTLFKIMPNGTSFAILLNFSSVVNGSYPLGSLITDGTFLYGMTRYGGTNGFGTLFKISPDGSGFAKLLDFDGAANGKTPPGSLISDGTFLYGMTVQGGTNDKGTIFKIMPDGSGFVKLLDFAGATNGSYPQGSLILDGTCLYGTTSGGGTNDLGTLFKIKVDGTGFAKLLDFAGSANGSNPRGSLFSDGAFLYGMTSDGGTNDIGTLFKIKPDGTNFAKLLDFNYTNGSYPQSSIVSNGAFLFGMTGSGGTNNMGTFFKIMPNGTGFVKILDFAGVTNGSYPQGSLFSDGTHLYGMTSFGGTNNLGTVFKYCPPITANASATTVCAGSIVTLTGIGTATSYTWSGGVSDGIGFIPAIGTTTYTVTGTGGNICSNTNTISVKVNPLPSVTATANPVTVCVGDSITFEGGGANSYAWTGGITNGIRFRPSLGTNTYTVTGTDGNGCSNKASVTITVDLCTGITHYSNLNTEVSIYPNPSNGIFTIVSAEKIRDVVIVNVLGETIYSSQINTSKTEIDLSNQPEGVYFINLKTENGNATKKIIISK